MKQLAGLLTLVFVLMPAATFAQTQPMPSPWPSGAPHPDFRAMQQMHDQMEQLHRTERTKMLDALTPQHRQLLANVVGQLAISPDPNRRAAAQQLDAALTPGEKQSISSIHQSAVTQMRSMMQEAFPNGPNRVMLRDGERPMPSAGELLLTVATADTHPMMRMRYHPMGPNTMPVPSPAAS